MALKHLATTLGIKKVEATNSYLRLTFDAQPKVEPLTLIKLIQSKPTIYKLDGPNRLKCISELLTAEQRLITANLLLTTLSQA